MAGVSASRDDTPSAQRRYARARPLFGESAAMGRPRVDMVSQERLRRTQLGLLHAAQLRRQCGLVRQAAARRRRVLQGSQQSFFVHYARRRTDDGGHREQSRDVRTRMRSALEHSRRRPYRMERLAQPIRAGTLRQCVEPEGERGVASARTFHIRLSGRQRQSGLSRVGVLRTPVARREVGVVVGGDCRLLRARQRDTRCQTHG